MLWLLICCIVLLMATHFVSILSFMGSLYTKNASSYWRMDRSFVTKILIFVVTWWISLLKVLYCEILTFSSYFWQRQLIVSIVCSLFRHCCSFIDFITTLDKQISFKSRPRSLKEGGCSITVFFVCRKKREYLFHAISLYKTVLPYHYFVRRSDCTYFSFCGLVVVVTLDVWEEECTQTFKL